MQYSYIRSMTIQSHIAKLDMYPRLSQFKSWILSNVLTRFFKSRVNSLWTKIERHLIYIFCAFFYAIKLFFTLVNVSQRLTPRRMWHALDEGWSPSKTNLAWSSSETGPAWTTDSSPPTPLEHTPDEPTFFFVDLFQ